MCNIVNIQTKVKASYFAHTVKLKDCQCNKQGQAK